MADVALAAAPRENNGPASAAVPPGPVAVAVCACAQCHTHQRPVPSSRCEKTQVWVAPGPLAAEFEPRSKREKPRQLELGQAWVIWASGRACQIRASVRTARGPLPAERNASASMLYIGEKAAVLVCLINRPQADLFVGGLLYPGPQTAFDEQQTLHLTML